jgi:dipeptidyl-peptidase-4
VAGAGSHDQLLYQFEWGERFIGPPADDPEAYRLQANRTRVEGLRGHLLLAHGDLDDDVHIANTMQLVDALVKANKDFELLIVPGRNHDSLFEDPYFIRRQWDFFVRHLRGETPPAGYRIGAGGESQSLGSGGGPSGR